MQLIFGKIQGKSIASARLFFASECQNFVIKMPLKINYRV